jgi:hypothetical protein
MSTDTSAAREEQAKKFDAIVEEVTKGAEHARIAAAHFRAGEVPRAGAHALALEGHLISARRLLELVAVEHAARARTIL